MSGLYDYDLPDPPIEVIRVPRASYEATRLGWLLTAQRLWDGLSQPGLTATEVRAYRRLVRWAERTYNAIEDMEAE